MKTKGWEVKVGLELNGNLCCFAIGHIAQWEFVGNVREN